MSQQLGLESVNFDRFKQRKRVSDVVKVPASGCVKPALKLVKV